MQCPSSTGENFFPFWNGYWTGLATEYLTVTGHSIKRQRYRRQVANQSEITHSQPPFQRLEKVLPQALFCTNCNMMLSQNLISSFLQLVFPNAPVAVCSSWTALCWRSWTRTGTQNAWSAQTATRCSARSASSGTTTSTAKRTSTGDCVTEYKKTGDFLDRNYFFWKKRPVLT